MSEALVTFFSAWSETDPSARGELIVKAMTGGATYADPRSGERLKGHDAIADYVGMFSANAPGWTAEVVKSDNCIGYVRAIVKFGGKGPDGNDMAQYGMYCADTNSDGLIVSMVGFVGESPS